MSTTMVLMGAFIFVSHNLAQTEMLPLRLLMFNPMIYNALVVVDQSGVRV